MGHGQADKIDFRKGLERALARIEALKHELHEIKDSRRKTSEALAVVGIGCRFPQIENPTELWQFLMDGRDAVREIPANRPELARMAELYPRTRWGALFESIDGFDARFFGMSPREANWLDPQQRLLLEACIEALEDSGTPLQQLDGTRTGVFIGMIGGPGYEEASRSLDPSELDAYTFTGVAHCIAAGRVAHTLGLQGPAMIVDTACSSSLVAIHLACQSLRRGECDQVLAGGVNLILSPGSSVMAAKVTALSDDGRCHTFDAAANGIARGEGVGVVVLKRLTDALAHGDQILAVVKGSAINHDGRAAGLGVPSVLAQTAVLKDALQDANVSAASIGFIETHGTGTSIGDPIELTALKNAIGAARSDGSTCRLGAIKSNLGHTEATAGVAGFIKCVLALRHGAIPPNLHFRVLNPRISLAGTPLTIPTEVTPWPAGAQPRRAGVSSFGMSGTNAHIVLEEFAPEARVPLSAASARRFVLPLSAHDAGALAQSAGRYASLLEAQPESALEDICFSAGHRRSHYATRLAVTGASREELCAGLRAFAAGGGAPNLVHDTVLPNAPVKVLFVFSGFGSQWPGMGRQLHASQPSFREAFDACSAELERLSGKSVTRALLAEANAASWADLETLQLLLFAMQVALASLWRSWGVEPDAVLGTSLGEIAAAHVAGALSLSDAANIVQERVRLLQRLVGSGSMLATELSLERATSALHGYEDRVGIAANNSPRSTILSGDTQALTELKQRLDEQGEFCRWVKGATGPGHSPAVDRIAPELREALQQLTPRAGDLPFYSSVTGAPLAGASLDANYWARNLREPVAFGPTLGLAIRDGHRVLIEISPHPVLLPSMLQVIAHERVACAALASERRDHDELTHLTQSLAQLFVHGGPIDFRRCYPSGRVQSLPTYPFQRRRFWNDPPIRSIAGLPAAPASSRPGHPLLGARFALSVPGLHVWQGTLRRSAIAWLSEHRIAGCELLPAAALIEMVAAAARELGSALPIALEAVTFHELPMLRADEHPALQLALTEAGAGIYQFRLSQAVASETAGAGPSWRLCVEGKLGPSDAATEPARTQPAPATAVDVYRVLPAQDTEPARTQPATAVDVYRVLPAQDTEPARTQPATALDVFPVLAAQDTEPARTQPAPAAATAVDVYSVLAAQDTVYGPTLRALERARCDASQLWAELSPLADAADSGNYFLSLSALEACFQAAACARRAWDPNAAPTPTRPRSIARLVVRAPLPERGQCRVVADRSGLSVVLSDSVASLTMEGLVLEELDEPTLAALQALRPAATGCEAPAQDLLATLQSSVDADERGALTREYLRREIARVSRARPEDITDDLPFLQLGIDSIMGLELRSRLETSFRLELPATVIYSYPDLNALSRFILEASGLAQDAPASDGLADKPERSSWILRPVPRGKQALRLFVFPFSGGNAAAYVQWASRLPDQIELCAVELPGRGFRFRQPAYEDFFALVDSLDSELRTSRDQPFALFGHSMGAMVAFELARRWSADGATPPQRLFVSGLPAPQWFDTTTLREALAEDRLLDHLAKWGAVAPAARDQDVLALGMPAMQADLRALASWKYRETAPLRCPITALRGTTDALTPLGPTQAWRQHTQSEFRLVTFPGDHFYFQVERARLLRVLADDLLSTHALVEQVSHGA